MSMMMPLISKSKTAVIEEDPPLDHLSPVVEDRLVDDVGSREESVVSSEIEKYASKLSVDECMDVLKGEDGIPNPRELLLIIGQSKEFNEFLVAHHPDVWKRMKGQLKSPKFWASMVPVVNLAVIGKGVRHAHRKKKAAKGMHGMDETMDHMMDVSESHQKQKRAVEVARGVLAVGTAVTGPMGLTVGAAATPLMGVGSGLLSTGIGAGINTGVGAGVGAGTQALTHELAGDDLSHVGEEVGDKGLSDYKTSRALLHFLGHGPRTSPEEMAVHGIEPEQEAARLLLKEQMGFDPESDLVGREKETRSRGRFLPKKHDWLTSEERGWYDKLKGGKVTMGDIPREHRLTMAWKLEKVFDADGALTEAAIAAIQGLPAPSKKVPVPKPDDVPGLGTMDLEDLKLWYRLETLKAPGVESDEPMDLVEASRLMKLESDLPDAPTTPIELDFETRLKRLSTGIVGPVGDELLARLKALNDGEDMVPPEALEMMELEARFEALGHDIDIDRTALEEMELQVRLARLQGELDESDGLARVSQMLVLLKSLPDAPKMSIEKLLETI